MIKCYEVFAWSLLDITKKLLLRSLQFQFYRFIILRPRFSYLPYCSSSNSQWDHHGLMNMFQFVSKFITLFECFTEQIDIPYFIFHFWVNNNMYINPCFLNDVHIWNIQLNGRKINKSDIVKKSDVDELCMFSNFITRYCSCREFNVQIIYMRWQY